MDYTKFLYGKNKEKNSFKLNITNNYIKESIQTLKDIKKANYILQNHHKFNYKFELDEYFAYFLKEKNSFISSFRQHILISKSNPEISEDTITIYKEILSILNSNLDNLITNFKMIKQNMYKKAKYQEKFFEKKFNFFAENGVGDDSKIDSLKDIPNKIKKFVVKNLPFDIENVEEKIKEKYKEASNVVEILMDKEKQNFEKTKKILFDLSSLVTNVQKKLHAQGEMTKNILFNSFKSVENVEQGNKHLKQAKEYQKGRGLIIGIVFIILGLFLLIYDR
jgi:hypothetical protein